MTHNPALRLLAVLAGSLSLVFSLAVPLDLHSCHLGAASAPDAVGIGSRPEAAHDEGSAEATCVGCALGSRLLALSGLGAAVQQVRPSVARTAVARLPDRPLQGAGRRVHPRGPPLLSS